MPVRIDNIKGEFRVSTPGGVKAKKTTKKKALAQEKILNAVEHSTWRPTKKK